MIVSGCDELGARDDRVPRVAATEQGSIKSIAEPKFKAALAMSPPGRHSRGRAHREGLRSRLFEDSWTSRNANTLCRAIDPPHSYIIIRMVFSRLRKMGLRGALRGFGLKVGRTTPRTFELLDFARQFLRRAPELGPPITRQLKLQLGDLGPRRQRVARHLGDNALQRGNVVGQGFRRDRHTRDWIRSATAWLICKR